MIDAAALFALTAGVAASLGAGIMTLADGIGSTFGATDGPMLRAVIGFVIVCTFVASSVSGLQRGIRLLSDVNIRVFIGLALFVLIAGPSAMIAKSALAGVGEYAATFVARSLDAPGDPTPWRRDWAIYYFTNWAAWAPVTALFLGRIALGYTVREFLLFTIVGPALFGILRMSIFGGAAIGLDQASGGAMTQAFQTRGPEAVMFSVLDELPFTAVMVGVFVFTTFISFVTAMDSNTHSIASLCLRARRQADEYAGEEFWIKTFWGVLIGAVAWTMTATNGVDGVRMLSNLGGGPGLIITIGSIVALVRLMLRPAAHTHRHPAARGGD